MQNNIVKSTQKNVASKVGVQIASARLWAAVAACLVLAATVLPVGGGGTGSLSGAQNYACSSVCFDRYYTCIVAGKGSTYCQAQLSLCLANCGGSARAGEGG